MGWSRWIRIGVLTLGAMAASLAPAAGPVKGSAAALPKGRAAAIAPAAAASAPAPTPDEPKRAGYTVAPVPAWVAPAPATNAPVDPSPMHYRFIDQQTRVEGSSSSVFENWVRVVREPAGLPIASQIEVEFDPDFQALVLHRLQVVRDGRRIDRLERQSVQILHREKRLEQRLYDGRVSASIVLDDVRVGDEIDFAFSVNGVNPVYGGRFVQMTWMGAQRGPVGLYRARLLAPSERRIAHRAPADVEVERATLGSDTETVFRRRSLPQWRAEPGTAASAWFIDQLQFSEFEDWAAIAAWGAQLFGRAAPGERVVRKADEIAAAHATPAARLLEALRFVQQDVRYFGIEIGIGSHQPAEPDRVIAQRFGDCKDKVALLNALLGRLGIDARPVLVSTALRGQVDRLLPSPLAFNHVIARVEVDGAVHWLDPTRGHQTGPLAARQVVGMGHGLDLAPGARTLTALPAAWERERMHVLDRIVVARFADDPVLESRVTYRGDLAEASREALATQGLAALAPSFAAPYARLYPKLRSLEAARIETAVDDDAVSIVQRFLIPGLWRFPEQRALSADVVHWAPIEWLTLPNAESRSTPLGIAFPGLVRHLIRVEFSEDAFTQASSRRGDEGDAELGLQLNVEIEPRHLQAEAVLRIGVDEVEPGRWAGFAARSRQLATRLAGSVVVPAVAPESLPALSARLKSIEDAMRSRRLGAVTVVQAQARLKSEVLSAQLGAGRLPPALRAEALVARGIAQDHLGRRESARTDFDAALALAPESIEALNGAATNAQGLGQWQRAAELATRVIERQPRDEQALHNRALASYFSDDLAAARRDWSALLQDGNALRRGFPLLWLSLATRRSGEALDGLVAAYPRERWPSEWPRPLLDHAFGKSSDDAVLVAARLSKNPLEALCEAHFYLGERLFVEGDAGRAVEHWRKAVDQGVVEYVEHAAAEQRLAARR